jgi:hypothetical protein
MGFSCVVCVCRVRVSRYTGRFMCHVPCAFVVCVSVAVPVVEEAHFLLIFYDTKIVNYVHIYNYLHLHKYVSFYFADFLLFLCYEILSASVFVWGIHGAYDFLPHLGVFGMAEKPPQKIGFCRFLHLIMYPPP